MICDFNNFLIHLLFFYGFEHNFSDSQMQSLLLLGGNE